MSHPNAPKHRKTYKAKHREKYLVQHRLDEKRRREKDPARHKERKKWAYVWQRYRLTKEQYEQMWAAQSGLCAICYNALSTGKKVAVDHDHATGAVRGFLCHVCNKGLGMFRDSANHLARALEYLTRYKS